MIDKKRIEEEAQHFFEWPDPKRKDHVTLTSCLIFAATIAEMVRAEERERCAALCDAEAAGFGGVVAGPMATERGKLVHEAMAAGAMNCAASIRRA